MFLTIEEMLDLQAKYVEEKKVLDAKIAVVSDMIALAQAKEPLKDENDGFCETETEEAVEETID